MPAAPITSVNDTSTGAFRDSIIPNLAYLSTFIKQKPSYILILTFQSVKSVVMFVSLLLFKLGATVNYS